MTTNQDYIEEYIQTKDLSPNTKRNLTHSLNSYCKHQQLTIHELLTEADQEEEAGIRWKNRTLKKRLINYTNHLKQDKSINTVKHRLKMVKAFYRHHEIEIGKLPPINLKNAKVNQPITYQDIPSKEVIRQAYDVAEPLMKALLLFLVSSGMSKVDCLNLQISDFITATSKFHQSDNIEDVLLELQQQENVIPTWKCRRQKTNKFFITFNTDEATKEICNYLTLRLKRKSLAGEDKLFKIDKDYYTLKFQELNNVLGLGSAGSFIRLHGHMLRKFHASNLERAGMDRYKINVLQGKSNGSVDDVYFLEDEKALFNEYVKYMGALVICDEVKSVDVLSDEYVELKKQNELLLQKLDEFEQLKKDIDRIKSWYVFD